MPERRQGIAVSRVRIVVVEGGGQRPHGEGGCEILHGLGPADPVFQSFQRHVLASSGRARDFATVGAGWKDRAGDTI